MTNLASPIPADDPARSLAVANPDIAKGRYVSVAGGTYTILLSGEETGGRYCLIDMRVPDGGGPPPHRHDFEEMFTILEGTLEFSFRGDTQTVNAGTTVNIPANAPHAFKNTSGKPARLLCMCTPPGQEEFFMKIGDRVDGPTTAVPSLSEEEKRLRSKLAGELAPQYRTEMIAK